MRVTESVKASRDLCHYYLCLLALMIDVWYHARWALL